MRFLHRPRAHAQRRFYGRLILLALLVAYAVAFVLENGTSVRVSFVFVHAHVSLIWLILLSIAVGLLGGILLGQLERRRHRGADEPAEPRDAV